VISGTHVVDLDGRRIQLSDVAATGLAWTPDGTELWGTAGSGLWAFELSGSSRLVYRSTVSLNLLDISADGTVLLANSTARREMAGQSTQGAGERNLTWFDWSTPQAISDDGGVVLFDEGTSSHEDGTALYFYRPGGIPARVFLLNLATRERELWHEIAPIDDAGVAGIDFLSMTRDGHSYVYSYRRILSRLLVIEGLR
jgi:hypothetical protein